MGRTPRHGCAPPPPLPWPPLEATPAPVAEADLTLAGRLFESCENLRGRTHKGVDLLDLWLYDVNPELLALLWRAGLFVDAAEGGDGAAMREEVARRGDALWVRARVAFDRARASRVAKQTLFDDGPLVKDEEWPIAESALQVLFDLPPDQVEQVIRDRSDELLFLIWRAGVALECAFHGGNGMGIETAARKRCGGVEAEKVPLWAFALEAFEVYRGLHDTPEATIECARFRLGQKPKLPRKPKW